MVNIQSSILPQLIGHDLRADMQNDSGNSPFTLFQQSQKQYDAKAEASVQTEPERTWLPAKAFVITSELGQKLSSPSVFSRTQLINDLSAIDKYVGFAKEAAEPEQLNSVRIKIVDDSEPAQLISPGFSDFLHGNAESIAQSGLQIRNSNESIYRILPFSALANEYLSLVNGSHALSISSKSTVTSNQNYNFDVYIRGLDIKPLEAMATVSADNKNALHPAAVLVNSQVSTPRAENTNGVRSVQLNLTTTAEFTRAYLMLTESDIGATVWYRDYQINGQERASLKKRVISGEWFQHNRVSRLFINGELIWHQHKEQRHD